MRYTYKGTAPIIVYEGKKSLLVKPGETIDLKSAPNHKFVQEKKDTMNKKINTEGE